MYSVILTELGVSVLNDGAREKTFPFKNAVSEYVAIKKKEAVPGGLVEYLQSTQRGVSTSDESLLELLKKNSIDVQMLDAGELEKIQSTKQQIIVDSGFASDPQDALAKLREFSLGLTSSRVTEVLESPDLHIVQAIDSLDEVDKVANMLSARLREWYGLHFPELETMADGIGGYAGVVLGGRRGDLTDQILRDAGFTESASEMILLVASKSIGGEISDINLAIVQSIARQVAECQKLRKNLEEHINEQMAANAPNLSAILGPTIGARILRRAGSLQKLSSLPASTIQILGAERARFRALKTGSNPPKHGILFQHQMVHAAPRWQRGKIARAIAAKAVIAARVDVYGEGLNGTLLDKLNVRVGEIGQKYDKPTEKPPRQKPERSGGRGFGRRDRGRQGSKKKRKKFARR